VSHDLIGICIDICIGICIDICICTSRPTPPIAAAPW
jgi:hypothetical protein